MTDPIDLSGLHVWQRPFDKLPFEITPSGKLRKDGKIIPGDCLHLFLGVCPPATFWACAHRSKKDWYQERLKKDYRRNHNRRFFHDGSFDPIPEISLSKSFEVNWQSFRWIVREYRDLIAASNFNERPRNGTDLRRWFDAEEDHRKLSGLYMPTYYHHHFHDQEDMAEAGLPSSDQYVPDGESVTPPA